MNKLFAKCLERGLSIVSAIFQTILTRINSLLHSSCAGKWNDSQERLTLTLILHHLISKGLNLPIRKICLPPTHTQNRTQKHPLEPARCQMTQWLRKGEEGWCVWQPSSCFSTLDPFHRVLSHCRNQDYIFCQSEFLQVTYEISHHVFIYRKKSL